MDRTLIKELYERQSELEGAEVTVCGWTRTVRDMKSFGFIELNDGSCFKGVQIVFDNSLKNFSELAKLNVGAAIVVKGIFKLTPEAKQPFEISAEEIRVGETLLRLSALERHSVEFQTVAHLRPRTNLLAVFRIRSVTAHAIHCFFRTGDDICKHPNHNQRLEAQ